jgi:hypothetical protein
VFEQRRDRDGMDRSDERAGQERAGDGNAGEEPGADAEDEEQAERRPAVAFDPASALSKRRPGRRAGGDSASVARLPARAAVAAPTPARSCRLEGMLDDSVNCRICLSFDQNGSGRTRALETAIRRR